MVRAGSPLQRRSGLFIISHRRVGSVARTSPTSSVSGLPFLAVSGCGVAILNLDSMCAHQCHMPVTQRTTKGKNARLILRIRRTPSVKGCLTTFRPSVMLEPRPISIGTKCFIIPMNGVTHPQKIDVRSFAICFTQGVFVAPIEFKFVVTSGAERNESLESVAVEIVDAISRVVNVRSLARAMLAVIIVSEQDPLAN